MMFGPQVFAEGSAVTRFALLLLAAAPLLALASGGRESPVSSPNNSGLTPTARPEPAPPGYHVVPLNGPNFPLPDGFTIELAAAPPLADRPIVAALDEKGRLYVCD